MSKTMNPEIKAKWVAALRSGQYQQNRGSLRRNDAFCCLGVLCELHRQEVGGEEWCERTGSGTRAYGRANALPPGEVSQWAGFDDDRKVTIGGVAARISAHNDGMVDNGQIPCRTFAEIAKAIEEQL
jgi:hypothetical protein